MGRPPVGKVAMTGAERTRAYRAKQRADAPVTKPAGPDQAVLVQELAQAKARIAVLEAELARRAQESPKRAAKPKIEKPPLPPDEARDRVIKGLTWSERNDAPVSKYGVRKSYDKVEKEIADMTDIFKPLQQENLAYTKKGPSIEEFLHESVEQTIRNVLSNLLLPDLEVDLVSDDHQIKIRVYAQFSGEIVHEHLAYSDMDVGDYIEELLILEKATHPDDRAYQIKTLTALRDRLSGFIAILESGKFIE